MEGQVAVDTTESGGQVEQGQEQIPTYKGTKHRVKIDGAEAEVDYDELIKAYQTGKASTKRFNEAAAKEKQVTQFLSAIKQDPFTALQQLGVDNIDEIAERRIAERIQWEMMPEEERERLELKKKLSHYEEREKTYKQQQEEARYQAEMASALQEVDTEIGQVLKQSGVKPTPKAVARIAELMLASLERGEKIPAAKAYERAQEMLRGEVVDYIASLPPQKAIEFFPKEYVDEIRKYFVNQVVEGKPFSTRQPTRSGPSNTSKQPIKSTDEFFKRLEKKFT